MIRITNDHLGRLLHYTLFNRMYNFCVKYTPEFPAEVAVNIWLNRVYNNDMSLHLLAEVDDNYNITEHALVDVQSARVQGGEEYKVVYCYQAQHDKPSISHAVELMEYLDKLKAYESAVAIIFSIANSKHAKTFEKRHNYKILRTVLIKTDSETEEEEADG